MQCQNQEVRNDSDEEDNAYPPKSTHFKVQENFDKFIHFI